MELMKAIAMRISTRSYKTEQITDEALNTILNAGYAAPISIGDYEAVHITVIQNPELLSKITKSTQNVMQNPNVIPMYGAPTLIVISGKPVEMFTIELANASCIIENMSLAATDIGLGSVYILGPIAALINDKELAKELNIPEGFVPAAAVAIGYPKEPLTKVRELKQTIETNVIR